MKTIAKRALIMAIVIVVVTGAVMFTPASETGFFGTTTVYAASKTSTSKQVKSLRKSIKSYNTKTQALAKRTPTAKKYAATTKSYYTKSLKAKKVKTLKSYKSKASNAYKGAQIVDYRAQIKTAYDSINSIYKSYSGIKPYYTKAQSIYNTSKKTDKISTLKDQLKQIKSQLAAAKVLRTEIDKTIKVCNDILALTKNASSMASYVTKANDLIAMAKRSQSTSELKSIHAQVLATWEDAKAHKATLKWYEAEYKTVEHSGYYKTVVVQKAEYKYMIVGYYGAVAQNAGYLTGSLYGWNLEQCIKNNCIFLFSEDKEEMKAWGCMYYQKDDGSWVDIIPSSEMLVYENYLRGRGINTQSRETGEWFLMKPEVTKQEWVAGYTEQVLVRVAGWY